MTDTVDLAKMSMDELRAHAERIGAQPSRSREQLLKNIQAVTEMPPPLPIRNSGVVYVQVRDECPHNMIQSAGVMWVRKAAPVRADDPRLPELRACELLLVSEAP